MRIEDVPDILRRLFPDSSVLEDELNEGGWDNFVFLSHDGHVYKYPRNPGYSTLEKEYRILKYLKPILPDLIPDNPEISISSGKEGQLLALRYRATHGKTVEERLLKDASFLQGLQAPMNRALWTIHNCNPPINIIPESSTYDAPSWRRMYREMLDRMRNGLFKRIPSRSVRMIQELISGFVKFPGNFRFVPTLVHADIDPRNMLIDDITNQVSGLIDWGDCMIGDPALDYASLFFDESLGLSVFRDQLELEPVSSAERVTFYHRMVPAYWIEYGLRINSDDIVRRGLDELEKRENFSLSELL